MELDLERLNSIIMAVDMARDELVTAMYMATTEREAEASELVNGAVGMLDQAMAILEGGEVGH